MCGTLPAVALGIHFSSSWGIWLLGLIISLIWGNAFEYVYHRCLLHRSGNPLGIAHRDHHAQIGTSEQAEHVALISSPLNVALLFVINGIPIFLISSLTGLQGILSGIFIGWTAYVIATEEIHWRIHMGGRLPFGLRFSRTYHMSHHARPESRYNVFLPLFDFLFGSTGSRRSSG